MTIVVRRSFESYCLPKDLAGVAVERDHFERVFLICADAVRMNKFFITHHVLRGFGSLHHLTLNRGSHKDLVVPNDWRRMAATVNRSFPLRSEERRVGKECRSLWSTNH